ncbi:MAG: methyltransferase domain-containing protein [Candidatus Omnitrophica bacterium]|nr:methyltransferase domain-containing protein [Candidatus Omnitrophota bacterium]
MDRYYIEQFLSGHASDIKGRVLEIAEPEYTRKFGQNKVSISEVLHVQAGNPQATLVGDLVTGLNVAEERYDCIILTQTLQFIYDFRAALANAYRALKPAGVLFLTVPGISQISRFDMDRWGDYWRFTGLSIEKIFKEIFSEDKLRIKIYGNVLSATAFLQGVAAQELKKEELDAYDDDYPVLICVKAIKGQVSR